MWIEKEELLQLWLFIEAIYGHMFLLYYEMQKAEYKIVAKT